MCLATRLLLPWASGTLYAGEPVRSVGARQEHHGLWCLATVPPCWPPPSCRFQKISVVGTLDSSGSQAQLDALAEAVERRCIVAATLRRVQGAPHVLSAPEGLLLSH